MQLWTTNGYLFGEATSAMQKSIRRGWTEQALYWAFELAGRYPGYVWRRLNVIVNEDIGIGTPEVITEFWRLPSNPKRTQHDLAYAVCMLCACRKTRLADRFMSVEWERDFRWRPIPTGEPGVLAGLMYDALDAGDEETTLDYALSLDPVDDGLLWRTLKAAADTMEVDYPFAAEAVPVLKAGCLAQIKGKVRGWESHMFIAQAILIICRRPELWPLPEVDLPRLPYDHRFDGREVPDVALDMHTGRGRKMGRGVEYFFTEGMVVEPEAMEYADAYLERFKAVCRAYEAAGGKIEKVPALVVGSEQLSLF
ncbi:MAG TPA: hypothetical protein VGJ87_04995, partial [Roseiflexaceae bacterium]